MKARKLHLTRGCPWAWATHDATTTDLDAVTCIRCRRGREFYRRVAAAGLQDQRHAEGTKEQRKDTTK